MRFFERFLNWIRAHALASSLVFLAVSPFVAFEVYASVYALRYDDCTFGSVSNARYRELLRRARWLHWSNDMFFIWGQFSDATSGQHEPAHAIVDLNLSNRLSEISGKSNDKMENIAAFHAMMRSFGANLEDINGSGPVGWSRFGEIPYTLNSKNPIVLENFKINQNDFYTVSMHYNRPSLFSFLSMCIFGYSYIYNLRVDNFPPKIRTGEISTPDGFLIPAMAGISLTISHNYPLGIMDFPEHRAALVRYAPNAPTCPWVPIYTAD